MPRILRAGSARAADSASLRPGQRQLLRRLPHWHECVESRMRREGHVRFGGPSGETGRLRGWYRASLGSNFLKVMQDQSCRSGQQ